MNTRTQELEDDKSRLECEDCNLLNKELKETRCELRRALVENTRMRRKEDKYAALFEWRDHDEKWLPAISKHSNDVPTDEPSRKNTVSLTNMQTTIANEIFSDDDQELKLRNGK